MYIPVIFYLFQKESIIMQLLNDIVIFLDIYHSKFQPLCHALVPIRLDGPIYEMDKTAVNSGHREVGWIRKAKHE